MATVEWIDHQITLDVSVGERLLDVIDSRPQPGTRFGCRSAHCGTCRVRVVEGRELLLPAAQDELETLSAIRAAPSERLACQLTVGREGRVRLHGSKV